MIARNRGLEPVLSAAMQRLSHLRGVLATRVFHLAEDFSGVTELQMATFTGEKLDRIEAAIAQLMAGNLFVRYPIYRITGGELTSDLAHWKVRMAEVDPDRADEDPKPVFHMYYLSDEGTIIVEHRDISSLRRIRARVHEDIRKDHHAGDQNQLHHTLQLNDCLAALTAAGVEVSAGYRACIYLPGNRQLVPDARMAAAWDLGDHVVEALRGNPRSQEFRRQVHELMVKYVPDARDLSRLQVTYVCENEVARAVVREEAARVCREYQVDLQAVPVLDAAVQVGPAQEGMPEVWRRVYMPLNWLLEYERTAVERTDIREKLMPIIRMVQGGHRVNVGFICETQLAAERFEEEHQRLQRAHEVSFTLVTSTHERVTTQARRGSPWSMTGAPVRLV